MRRVRRHSIGGSVPVLPSESQQRGGDEKSDKEKAMVVAVRIRPLTGKEIQQGFKPVCSVINESVVTIRRDCKDGGFLKSQASQINEYAFDRAFGMESSQKDVYQETAKPFIPNLLKGLHVTVFAYGATGAGKTHTMLGNARVDDATMHTSDAGIIPQAVKDLFDQIEEKRENLERGESWTVTVTFVEIYNEQVFDLLNSSSKPLSLREDTDKGVVIVAGVNERTTESACDVMDLLAQGNKNRKTEATLANAVSSRSHAVLQLCIRHVTRSPETGRETFVESKLSLIDLAGSERASATNNRGARLHEGANINKSLLALANCINALASNSSSGKKMNVKYRDSRLTHLLKSSLEGGNCNLVMIANINPSHTTFEDSHNTLKYANRAKNIKVNPTVTAASVESNWMQREEHLREENRALRARIVELEALVKSLSSQATSLKAPIVEPSKERNLGLKISQDDIGYVPSSTLENLEQKSAKKGASSPAVPVAKQVEHSKASESKSDLNVGVANPFLGAIMPKSRKRKSEDGSIHAKATIADRQSMDMDIDVNVDTENVSKENEVRGASLVGKAATPPRQNKRTRNSLGGVVAPDAPVPSVSSRHYKTRRASLGSEEPSCKGSEGGIITFNAEVAAPGFTIAEDESLIARPPKIKPSAVSTRRKSLAAVNAMLDSIVDENAFEGKFIQPKRALPDLGRLFNGKARVVEGSKENGTVASLSSKADARRVESKGSHAEVDKIEMKSGLSEEVWIDI